MVSINTGVFFSIHLSDTRYSDLDLNSIKHFFVSVQDSLTAWSYLYCLDTPLVYEYQPDRYCYDLYLLVQDG